MPSVMLSYDRYEFRDTAVEAAQKFIAPRCRCTAHSTCRRTWVLSFHQILTYCVYLEWERTLSANLFHHDIWILTFLACPFSSHSRLFSHSARIRLSIRAKRIKSDTSRENRLIIILFLPIRVKSEVLSATSSAGKEAVVHATNVMHSKVLPSAVPCSALGMVVPSQLGRLHYRTGWRVENVHTE